MPSARLRQGIYAAVHVIRDETGAVRVIGKDCYATLTGHQKATDEGPSFGGWGGRRLTLEERNAMLADTAAFVARMEAYEAEQENARLAAEAAKLSESREQQATAARLRQDHSGAPPLLAQMPPASRLQRPVRTHARRC